MVHDTLSVFSTLKGKRADSAASSKAGADVDFLPMLLKFRHVSHGFRLFRSVLLIKPVACAVCTSLKIAMTALI